MAVMTVRPGDQFAAAALISCTVQMLKRETEEQLHAETDQHE